MKFKTIFKTAAALGVSALLYFNLTKPTQLDMTLGAIAKYNYTVDSIAQVYKDSIYERSDSLISVIEKLREDDEIKAYEAATGTKALDEIISCCNYVCNTYSIVAQKADAEKLTNFQLMYFIERSNLSEESLEVYEASAILSTYVLKDKYGVKFSRLKHELKRLESVVKEMIDVIKDKQEDEFEDVAEGVTVV